MKKTIVCFLVLVLGCQLNAQNEKIVQGKLKSATLFRKGAELTHIAKSALVSGNNEIIIENLSASIDENSLRINCTAGVSVLGSEFSKDYLSVNKPSQLVRKLQDSIDYCNDRIATLKVVLETNKELRALLKDNRVIAGAQTGLKVEELSKMLDYYQVKSIELEKEKSSSEKEIKQLEKNKLKFETQLNQEKRKNDKVVGRLKLKLSSPMNTSCDFMISYYTSSAYWVPYYDLQAVSSDKPIKLISKAKFMQTTGLDWEKVALSLSTATPNNGKIAPVFNAWFLKYTYPEISEASGNVFYNLAPEIMKMEDAVAQNSISDKKDGMRIRGTSESTGSNQPMYVVDGRVISEDEFQTINPDMIANIEILKDAASTSIYGSRGANGVVVITLKNNFVSSSENHTDITYSVDLPYDVLGTGSEQSITLQTIELPAKFEYYCAPKLDNTVYLLAGISDWAQYNLLSGEANITYDGTYAGKTIIDPASTKDVLYLTLGNDKRVNVKREKLQDYSSTKFLGSDKKQVFTYLLTVKNNKNIPVDMILKDQYPISTDKSINVELIETAEAHINEEVGTLTWEFLLKPGETKTLKVSYSVKYPKDKQINL